MRLLVSLFLSKQVGKKRAASHTNKHPLPRQALIGVKHMTYQCVVGDGAGAREERKMGHLLCFLPLVLHIAFRGAVLVAEGCHGVACKQKPEPPARAGGR